MCVSGKTSTQQENGSAVACGTSSRFINAEILDFSSPSEDEDPCGSRSKAKWPNAGEEFGPSTGPAANMNLSALLMKHMTSGMQKSSESSEDSQSDTDSKGLNLKEATVAKAQTGWFLSSDSEEEKHEAPSISPHAKKASEKILRHHYTKAQQRDKDGTNEDQRPDRTVPAVQRQRFTDEVESFDSSEDEASVRRVKFRKSLRRPFSAQNSAHKSVQFTGLKCPSVHCRRPQIIEETITGTMDTFLGKFLYKAFSELQ